MFNKIIKNKYIILATILLVVLISPLLYMFTGAHMAADDYVYGSNTHAVYENTGSFFNVIKEAINSTKWWYNNWQGSFVSVFFMIMQPGVFSLATYRIILCFMFLLGIASLILLGSLVNKFYIKMPNKYMALIVCSIIFIWTQYLPSVFEGYYWYNSTVYYSFTFYIVLITVSLIILFHNAKSKPTRIAYYILLVISVIMIAGSNYPMALTFSLALAFYVLLTFIKKNAFKWYFFALFIVFITIFIINISAPGNALRGGHYAHHNLFYIGILTIREFMTQTVKWMLNTPTLAFICVSLPFSSIIVKNSRVKFINPLILAIILMLLMMSQYVPPLFAIGNAGPLRAENVRFMLFCIFMWGFFINLYGWYYQQQKNSIHVSKLIATILTIITLSISINKISIYETWSNKAFDHMWGKRIVALNNEMEKRIKYVKENSDLLEDYKEYACINDMIRPSDDMWWDEYVIDYFNNKPFTN